MTRTQDLGRNRNHTRSSSATAQPPASHIRERICRGAKGGVLIICGLSEKLNYAHSLVFTTPWHGSANAGNLFAFLRIFFLFRGATQSSLPRDVFHAEASITLTAESYRFISSYLELRGSHFSQIGSPGFRQFLLCKWVFHRGIEVRSVPSLTSCDNLAGHLNDMESWLGPLGKKLLRLMSVYRDGEIPRKK